MNAKLAWVTVCWLGSLAWILCPLTAAADEALSRYLLEVGQELSYRGTSHFQYEGGAHDYEQQWQVWVVDKKDDGSWRLVMQESMTFGRGGSPRVHLGYFDMFPDGRIVANDSLGYQMDPAALFVRLPQDGQELREGWEAVDDQKELRRTYHRQAADADSDAKNFVVEVVHKSPMDEIYLSTSEATVTFDTDRGLVERIDMRNTQGYGFNGEGTGEVTLQSVELRDLEWLKAFRADTDAYFAADREYQELAEKSQHDAEQTATLLEEAKAVLEYARDEVSSPDIRSLLSAKLDGHDSMVSYYTDSAKRRAEVLGKPAHEFETEDLDGHAQKLLDYRGKVVILDFWYRGCGWCIRAMPQVKEVAEKYENQPVVVFGMNTDRQEEDALFVVDKMGLDYPNLKATGLPEKYGVQGFPTLIIIDQEGVVRDIHVGYSADLAEKVSQKLDELLAGS